MDDIIKSAINYNNKNMKKSKFIVKITSSDNNTNKRDYYIYNKVKSIKGFIKHYCIYNCLEDDTCKNLYHKDNYIIISKYYNNSSIKNFKWKADNIYILKSLIKQILISLMEAYNKYGFIHKNIHLDNYLIKSTKKEYIEYKDINIKSEGYKVAISDFDLSIINIDINNDYYIYYYWANIIFFFSRIECDLLLNYGISTTNRDKLYNLLYKYQSDHINANKTLDLLELIDDLNIKISSSILYDNYKPTLI